MISEGLPPGLRMGNDVKEMIVECCNEFIQTISSEANEISTKENKTTILPEHVVAALESLDFASMVETVKATMNDIKEEDKEVRAEKKKKGENAQGKTFDELSSSQRSKLGSKRAGLGVAKRSPSAKRDKRAKSERKLAGQEARPSKPTHT